MLVYFNYWKHPDPIWIGISYYELYIIIPSMILQPYIITNVIIIHTITVIGYIWIHVHVYNADGMTTNCIRLYSILLCILSVASCSIYIYTPHALLRGYPLPYCIVVSWYPSLLLRGGVYSVHVVEAMSGPILLQSIPGEPPETRSFCGISLCVVFVCVTLSSLLPSPHIVAFAHRERGRASVCLSRGLIVGMSFALRPHSCHFWIRSFWTASVEPADKHPTVFLTLEPSTAVFRVCCGTVISRSSCRLHLSVCPLFLPAPFNRDPVYLYQRALSGLPETITQLELQSSSFALTHLFGYWQLNIECSIHPLFHAHTLTIQLTVLVTVSAAR